MIHANEGTLQAFLDEELPAESRTGLERHLGKCPACATELEGLRAIGAELSAALRVGDVLAPAEAAFREFARARQGHAPHVGWGVPLRRAAVLLLGVAGVASAAIPGSPLREWMGSRSAAPDLVSPPALTHTAGGAEVFSSAGVSILPADGQVRILLTTPAPELQVRVRLSEGTHAEVQASGEAAQARFRTGSGRIEVVRPGGGEIRVILPRGARSASVEIDGTPYLAKDGEQLRVLVPTVGTSAGAEIIFRVGS